MVLSPSWARLCRGDQHYHKRGTVPRSNPKTTEVSVPQEAGEGLHIPTAHSHIKPPSAAHPRQEPAAVLARPSARGAPRAVEGRRRAWPHQKSLYKARAATEPSKSWSSRAFWSCPRKLTSLSRLFSAALLAPGRQPQAGRLLTVDVHGPADVGAAQRIGDLAGDGLKEEGVVYDGFIEVTGRFFYHLAFLCPPVRQERAKGGCGLVLPSTYM